MVRTEAGKPAYDKTIVATWGKVTVAESMEVAVKLYVVSSGCVLKVIEMKFADR